MAALTKTIISTAGVAPPTFIAATSGGETFENEGNTYLHIKTTTTAITATIVATSACNFGSVHNLPVSIPAASERMIGPFNPAQFGTSARVTYSAVTGVTVAAIQFS